MNPIKCVAYMAVLSFDTVKFKINHILQINEFRRSVEIEQEKRHRELEAYMKRYLECAEKSRAEEE